jgi:hypothetical protein
VSGDGPLSIDAHPSPTAWLGRDPGALATMHLSQHAAVLVGSSDGAVRVAGRFSMASHTAGPQVRRVLRAPVPLPSLAKFSFGAQPAAAGGAKAQARAEADRRLALFSPVSASETHVVALATAPVAGAVIAAGSNNSGELGQGDMTARRVPCIVRGTPGGVVGVHAGKGFTAAVTRDGELWMCGKSFVPGNFICFK